MSRAITLAYEIAAIRSRYQEIHNALFKFSLRNAIPLPGLRRPIDLATHDQDLNALRAQIVRIQGDLAALSDHELTKRAATEIRDMLRQYAESLEETVARLQTICRALRREREGHSSHTDYRAGRYLTDLAAYDASIQCYRKLGKRLDELFSSF